MPPHRPRPVLRPDLLEDRATPATFTVTVGGASEGAGSLRQAILDANASPGPDTIRFAVGTGPVAITPQTPLPVITDPVTLDGTTQPGYAGRPVVALNGMLIPAGASESAAVPGFSGLVLAGHTGSTIRGLSIERFNSAEPTAGHGIDVRPDGGGHTVAGNFIGISGDGQTVLGVRNSGAGVRVVAGAGPATVIGGTAPADRNVISGNAGDGVAVAAGEGVVAANAPAVRGNYLGTAAAGSAARGNGGAGVAVRTTAGRLNGLVVADNLVSGNAAGGILVAADGTVGGADVPNARIAGNTVGTNLAGTVALGNGPRAGVELFAVTGPVVGGPAAADRNLVSGNAGGGIVYANATRAGSVAGPVIQGNAVGTDFDGRSAVPNGGPGIAVSNTAPLPTPAAGATGLAPPPDNLLTGVRVVGNLVGGNAGAGVVVSALPAVLDLTNPPYTAGSGQRVTDVPGAVIAGNRVGLSADGADALPNGGAGISVQAATGAVVGGPAAADRNVVAGNAQGGIAYSSARPGAWAGPTVQGNFVGVDPAGAAARGNAGTGVAVTATGGALSGVVVRGNLVSGNGADGIALAAVGAGADVPGAAVRGNTVGTDAAGGAALPNGGAGVLITGTSGAAVGGTAAGDGNLVAGNGGAGIGLADATGFAVLGNRVGLTAGGAALPNGGPGIRAAAAGRAATGTVGGAGAGNVVVAAADQPGVLVTATGGPAATVSVTQNRVALFAGGIRLDGTSANEAAPAPALTGATPTGGGVQLAGTLAGARVNETYRVEFFSDDDRATYLGAVPVTTNGAGQAAFTFTAAGSFAAGTRFAATAARTATGAASPYGPAARLAGGGAVVSGFVFVDADGDGLKGAGEAPAPLRVFADLDRDGAPDPDEPITRAAAADGRYTLDLPRDGMYTLVAAAEPGFAGATAGPVIAAGGGPAAGPDLPVARTGGVARGVLFEDADGDGVRDAGERALGPADGFRAFADLDGDGLADPDEPAAVPAGAVPEFALAVGADGTYAVTGGPAAGYEATTAPAAVTLAGGNAAAGLDFGFRRKTGGTVSGTVFFDTNGDGIPDPGTTPFTPDAAVRVYLDINPNDVFDPIEAPYSQPVDPLDGAYSLRVDADGTYRVRLTVGPSTAYQVVQTTPPPPNAALTGGATAAASFGYKLGGGGVVVGSLFDDADGDGARGPGEGPGVFSGVRVYIDANNNTQYDAGEPSTITGGAYQLAVPGNGTYSLRVAAPARLVPTGTFPRPVTVAGGLPAAGPDLGLRPTGGTVTGQVFLDPDGTGTRGPGEPAVAAGVAFGRVYLDLNNNNVFDPAAEPSSTSPRFALAAPDDGTYAVRVAAAGGYAASAPATVALAGGGGAAAEVGVRPTVGGLLTGRAFLDGNGNQAFDAGEAPVAGLTVFADADADGALDDGEAAATTAADGTYAVFLPADRTVAARSLLGATYTPTTGPPPAVLVSAGRVVPGGNFGLAPVGNRPPAAADDAAAGAEDGGPVAVSPLDNDADPDGQPLRITAADPGDRGGAVAVTNGGLRLAYTPAADFFGTETFAYTISDGAGGTAQGRVTVTVAPRNDAPGFAAGANRSAAPGVPQTIPGWATGIRPGPANEAGQALAFQVTADAPGLFAAGPAVDPAGTLTFTLAAGASGATGVRVVLRDNGGTANGGSDASPAQAFVITAGGGPTPGTGPAREYAAGAGAGGAVRLFGASGSERLSLTAFAGTTRGVRAATADFNRDGVADLVVGTGPGGPTRVRVLDGSGGRELFAVDPFEAAFTGGVYVAAGDIDGDGVPEVVVSPDEGGGPRVQVYRGAGWGKLADFFGIDDPNFRGGARAGVGDVDGDGFADLLVAAGFGGGPRVAGFRGSELAKGNTKAKVFGDFFVFRPNLRDGVFLTAGDLDGDGRADLIAGAGPGGGPRVVALSATDVMAGRAPDLVNGNGDGYSYLANFFAGNQANRGGVRVGVKNLDGDARADLVVGDGVAAGSRVTTYLGKSFGGGAPAEAGGFDAFPGSLDGVFVG